MRYNKNIMPTDNSKSNISLARFIPARICHAGGVPVFTFEEPWDPGADAPNYIDGAPRIEYLFFDASERVKGALADQRAEHIEPGIEVLPGNWLAASYELRNATVADMGDARGFVCKVVVPAFRIRNARPVWNLSDNLELFDVWQSIVLDKIDRHNNNSNEDGALADFWRHCCARLSGAVGAYESGTAAGPAVLQIGDAGTGAGVMAARPDWLVEQEIKKDGEAALEFRIKD